MEPSEQPPVTPVSPPPQVDPRDVKIIQQKAMIDQLENLLEERLSYSHPDSILNRAMPLGGIEFDPSYGANSKTEVIKQLTLEVGKVYITRGGWEAVVIYERAPFVFDPASGPPPTKNFYVIHKPGVSREESLPMQHGEDGRAHSGLVHIGSSLPTYNKEVDHPADIVRPKFFHSSYVEVHSVDDVVGQTIKDDGLSGLH